MSSQCAIQPALNSARFRRDSPLKRRSGEYIHENFWSIMDPSEGDIDAQCDLVGEDRFLWGSDYPHVGSHLTAMQEVEQALAPMAEARRNKLLGGNAKRLFNISVH